MSGFTFVINGPESIRRIIAALAKLPSGWVVTLSQAKRTSEQNDKMWAMLTDVSVAKPEGRVLPPEIWKSLFMAEAGFKPRFEPSLDGNGVVPIGYKSSRLKKAEFSDLIECIYAYGAENGVQWSEPNPYEQRREAA